MCLLILKGSFYSFYLFLFFLDPRQKGVYLCQLPHLGFVYLLVFPILWFGHSWLYLDFIWWDLSILNCEFLTLKNWLFNTQTMGHHQQMPPGSSKYWPHNSIYLDFCLFSYGLLYKNLFPTVLDVIYILGGVLTECLGPPQYKKKTHLICVFGRPLQESVLTGVESKLQTSELFYVHSLLLYSEVELKLWLPWPLPSNS